MQNNIQGTCTSSKLLNILSIGQFSADGLSNTCLHRNWALKKCGDVDEIDSTLSKHQTLYRVINFLFCKFHLPIYFPSHELNSKIVEAVRRNAYDIVWIDKGVFVSGNTLKAIKRISPATIILGYSPDNMAERHNQSQRFLDSLPYYDHYVTTKSYIVEKLKSMGAKDVIFVNNAYEETFHHPYDITPVEKERLGGQVGFIGSWEEERFFSMKYLADHGIPVRVWGGGKWKEYIDKIPNLIVEGRGLFSEDYNKALSAFDISLCFLRKINFDQQTTRTMEIPACKSMLMAERTDEHMELFEDGKEAIFFSDNKELYEKCQYYLQNIDKCHIIAEAGRNRCIKSGYSNEQTIKNILKAIGVL